MGIPDLPQNKKNPIGTQIESLSAIFDEHQDSIFANAKLCGMLADKKKRVNRPYKQVEKLKKTLDRIEEDVKNHPILGLYAKPLISAYEDEMAELSDAGRIDPQVRFIAYLTMIFEEDTGDRAGASTKYETDFEKFYVLVCQGLKVPKKSIRKAATLKNILKKIELRISKDLQIK